MENRNNKELKVGKVISRNVSAIVKCPACGENFYLEHPGMMEGLFGKVGKKA